MATRSLNDTGRSRITHEMFDASLSRETGEPVLKISWDITPLSIRSKKKLVVDISNDRVEQRVELSEVGADVGEIIYPLSAEFAVGVTRIRIVAVTEDASGIPIIRAESVTTSFSTSGESTSKSILVVEPVADLAVIWELDFDSGDVILKVSNKDNLWSEQLRQSQIFKSTIIGHIVYAVALHLLATRDELAAGLVNWQNLLVPLGLNIDDSDEADVEDLMDHARDVSHAFQEDRKLLSHLISNLEEIE